MIFYLNCDEYWVVNISNRVKMGIGLMYGSSLNLQLLGNAMTATSTIALLDEMPVFNIMVTLGTPDCGTCVPGLSNYWFAPGTQPHLHVPGVTRGRGSGFKAHSAGHPLKHGGT